MLPSTTALHLPDGFLSPLVAAIGWVIALVFIIRSLRRTEASLGQRQVPLMGILAAFIFAAQAINFPIVAGTSGHLLGGTLAAVILGPWAATLVMTAVIVLQGLLFQDGGLLVMGWNIVNMGVLTAFVGYSMFQWVQSFFEDRRQGQVAGAFVGAWLSVVVGAMATSAELAGSGTFPLWLALPTMTGVHALIGLGEAVITVATLAFMASVRPGIMQSSGVTNGHREVGFIFLNLMLAITLALLSPLGSSSPDGLEAFAENSGFAERALEPIVKLLPGYTVPLISNPVLTTMVAVSIGTVLVFFIGLALGRATTNSPKV